MESACNGDRAGKHSGGMSEAGWATTQSRAKQSRAAVAATQEQRRRSKCMQSMRRRALRLPDFPSYLLRTPERTPWESSPHAGKKAAGGCFHAGTMLRGRRGPSPLLAPAHLARALPPRAQPPARRRPKLLQPEAIRPPWCSNRASTGSAMQPNISNPMCVDLCRAATCEPFTHTSTTDVRLLARWPTTASNPYFPLRQPPQLRG